MECAAVEQPSRLRGGGRAFCSDLVWERTIVALSVVAYGRKVRRRVRQLHDYDRHIFGCQSL